MRILYIGCVKSSYRELKLLIEHKKMLLELLQRVNLNLIQIFVIYHL